MLNRVILIGRLTRDPDLSYTPNGTAVAKFTLAVNRKFNKEETDFIDCQVWRGLAETCASYLAKGSLVAVEGRLQVRNYEDRDGKKRKAVEVVVDDARFLSPKSSSSGSSSSSSSSDHSLNDWKDLGSEIDLSSEDDIRF